MPTATSTAPRYRLDVNGHRYEVETRSSGLSTLGRLFVDDVPVDEQNNQDEAIHLAGGGLGVVVRLNWLGQIKQILAAPSGADPKTIDEEGMVFAPPPGSRAARLDTLQREHPVVFAARHVGLAVLQVLVGVLGIGALLRGLLPRIDLPAIPIPDLPEILWPDLPDIPWPSVPVPDIDLPRVPFLDQLGAVWSQISWVVPIVVGVAIAVNEVNKRRKRERAEAARRQDGANSDKLMADSR